MSVIFVQEVSGPPSSFKWSGEKFVKTYEIHFFVRTDDPLDRADLILSDPRLPIPVISRYPLDLFAYCESVNANQEKDDPYTWQVVAQFTTDINEQEANEQNPNDPPNPTSKPTKISFATRARKIVREEDHSTDFGAAQNQAYVNSAEEPFDPPVEIDAYNLVITIEKNVLVFDQETAWNYTGWCNEDVFAIYGVEYDDYVLRIVDWSGTPEQDGNVQYYKQRVEIEAQWPDWSTQRLNQGRAAWKDDGNYNKKLAALDVVGIPLAGPIMLAANGVALAVGAAPTYKTFYDYPKIDFNGLDIL